MRDMRFLAFLCSLLMVATIVLELLTPSMGALSLVALCLFCGSSWLAFQYSDSFGFIMLGQNVGLLVLSVWLGMKLLKHSPLVNKSEVGADSQSTPDATPLAHLVGKTGKTLSLLRPGGAAEIDGQRVDVVSEGKFIEPGTAVRVLRVEGNTVVVEAVEGPPV